MRSKESPGVSVRHLGEGGPAGVSSAGVICVSCTLCPSNKTTTGHGFDWTIVYMLVYFDLASQIKYPSPLISTLHNGELIQEKNNFRFFLGG